MIAEGTPGQLKASVGSGTLHVRVADPGDRGAARALLERVLAVVGGTTTTTTTKGEQP